MSYLCIVYVTSVHIWQAQREALLKGWKGIWGQVKLSDVHGFPAWEEAAQEQLWGEGKAFATLHAMFLYHNIFEEVCSSPCSHFSAPSAHLLHLSVHLPSPSPPSSSHPLPPPATPRPQRAPRRTPLASW